MSLKRATFTVRPRTREVIHYRTAKATREMELRERRREKQAMRARRETEH
jgi:hypothetical protein